LIVIDDIERLIEFIHIGPRFSNTILQSLLVLIKKRPPQDKKLLVIGTTSMKRILQDLEVVDSFNTCQAVPLVSMEEEIISILSNFNCGSSSNVKKIA
jgi:vesicle-fusing ATPase